jgi:predicted transcriptional regulator
MTEVTTLTRQRALVAKSIIDAFRVFSVVYCGTPKIGDNADHILIGAALMVGEAENRPMSATDISEYLGIPRATVVRKLQQLHQMGHVYPTIAGRRTQYRITLSDKPEVIEGAKKNIHKWKMLSRELSEMDAQNGR